jgi:hypothetical protein
MAALVDRLVEAARPPAWAAPPVQTTITHAEFGRGDQLPAGRGRPRLDEQRRPHFRPRRAGRAQQAAQVNAGSSDNAAGSQTGSNSQQQTKQDRAAYGSPERRGGRPECGAGNQSGGQGGQQRGWAAQQAIATNPSAPRSAAQSTADALAPFGHPGLRPPPHLSDES